MVQKINFVKLWTWCYNKDRVGTWILCWIPLAILKILRMPLSIYTIRNMATAQKINSKTVCTDWGKIFLFQDSMPCPALQRMRIWRKYFIKLNQECHQRRGIHQHVYKDVSCGMLTVEHFVSSARSSLRNQMQVQVRRRAIFSLSPMPQFHNSRSKIASMSSMPLKQFPQLMQQL